MLRCARTCACEAQLTTHVRVRVHSRARLARSSSRGGCAFASEGTGDEELNQRRMHLRERVRACCGASACAHRVAAGLRVCNAFHRLPRPLACDCIMPIACLCTPTTSALNLRRNMCRVVLSCSSSHGGPLIESNRCRRSSGDPLFLFWRCLCRQLGKLRF